jgi:hypothetical protein
MRFFARTDNKDRLIKKKTEHSGAGAMFEVSVISENEKKIRHP